MLPAEDSSQLQRQTWAQSEWVEDDTAINGIQKKSRYSSIYIKINRIQDFKKGTGDKDEYFIMIEVEIHQEGITLINIICTQLGSSQNIKSNY